MYSYLIFRRNSIDFWIVDRLKYHLWLMYVNHLWRLQILIHLVYGLKMGADCLITSGFGVTFGCCTSINGCGFTPNIGGLRMSLNDSWTFSRFFLKQCLHKKDSLGTKVPRRIRAINCWHVKVHIFGPSSRSSRKCVLYRAWGHNTVK